MTLIGGLLAPLAVAGVMVPWRTHLPNTDAALVLVVVIVAVAVASGGRRAGGIVAALSAAFWFDLFLTQPYGQLSINRSTDIETTVLLLVVGVAVTELAVRGHHHRTHAQIEAAYVSMLHGTAELIAPAEAPSSDVIDRVSGHLKALLGLRDCVYQDGTLIGRHPLLQPDGHILWDETRWDIEQYGLPRDQLELRVRGGGRYLGRFLLTAGEPRHRAHARSPPRRGGARRPGGREPGQAPGHRASGVSPGTSVVRGLTRYRPRGL